MIPPIRSFTAQARVPRVEPGVHARQAQQGDARLDAAGPCSPAFWPMVVLSSGTRSWGPGLDAPLFRTRLAPREGPQTMLAVPEGVEPQGACHVLSPVL